MDSAQTVGYFLQQGILGIIIIVLGSVILWMQKKLDKKDEEIKALYVSIGLIQEKRIADNSGHIQSIVSLGNNLVNSDEAIQKSVDNIARVLELKK